MRTKKDLEALNDIKLMLEKYSVRSVPVSKIDSEFSRLTTIRMEVISMATEVQAKRQEYDEAYGKQYMVKIEQLLDYILRRVGECTNGLHLARPN